MNLTPELAEYFPALQLKEVRLFPPASTSVLCPSLIFTSFSCSVCRVNREAFIEGLLLNG